MDREEAKRNQLQLCLQFFGHVPNEEQAQLFQLLVDFSFEYQTKSCFVLKGYAGTGKTSILGAFIKSLRLLNHKAVLMAPTGRAAKVLSLKSGFNATTFHKRIYFTETFPDGSTRLSVVPNKAKNTIFIIDEASMIGDHSLQPDGSVSRNLLEDVMQFVFSGDNCKLILLGDEGQLPPVGSSESPALSSAYLEHHFSAVHFTIFGLTEVVRQAKDSGILEMATSIRNAARLDAIPSLNLKKFKDVQNAPGEELIGLIESNFDRYGSDEVMIITRSNKRAILYNQHIRARILYQEDEICGGDLIMVVKNNYFWLDPLSSAGFIANGELLKIHRVRRIEEIYGVRFAHIEVSLIDYPEMDRFETIAFLDTLTNEHPQLPREEQKKLFFEIEKDFLHEKNKQKRYKEIMKSPYFNALQIKFAYAITCHKAQGGQWQSIFIDHGFLDESQIDFSFLRWLYTAITRASHQVYFVNLHEMLQEEVR